MGATAVYSVPVSAPRDPAVIVVTRENGTNDDNDRCQTHSVSFLSGTPVADRIESVPSSGRDNMFRT